MPEASKIFGPRPIPVRELTSPARCFDRFLLSGALVFWAARSPLAGYMHILKSQLKKKKKQKNKKWQ